ncbi:MAG: hypothetical protein ACP5E4_00650, partial [Candidatus Aenigmatarchaeota archaeon]
MGFLTCRSTGSNSSSAKGGRRKGQWYIVAAVLFSYSLLTFFYIFQSYSGLDYTTLLKNDEDIIFMNVYRNMNNLSERETQLSNLDADFGEYLELVNGNLLGKGLFVDYNISTGMSGIYINYLEISGKNLDVQLPAEKYYCVNDCPAVTGWSCVGEINQSCGYYDMDICLDLVQDDCSDCSCHCGNYGLENEVGYCGDGKDNDCDGLTDAEDILDCATYETSCVDGIDNDHDGDIDCRDSDCIGQTGPGGQLCCTVAGDCVQDDCVAETCGANKECSYSTRPQCDSTECSGQSRCHAAGGDCKDPDIDSTVCTVCYSGHWDTDKCCG